MKRLLSLLVLVAGLSGLLPSTTSNAFTVTYAGADNSNDYADKVIQAAGGVLTEKTSAASNTTSNDTTLYKTASSGVLVGYSETFDGLSADVYTSASGGAYKVEYWNGSAWTTLQSITSASITDSTDGTFQLDWDTPSDWDKTTVLMDIDEDGNTNQYSGYYYFVRIIVTSAYANSATFTQIGVINYNLEVNLEDELGNALTDYTSSYSFNSTAADDTVYVSKSAGNGVEYYGFYVPSAGAAFSYTVTVPGYVSDSKDVTLDKGEMSQTFNLDYAHKIVALDAANTSDRVTISSATAGTDDTECVISSGNAYCPVPVGEDNDIATVSASGYTTESVSIPNRSSDSDDQELTNIYLDDSHGYGADTEADLSVDDLYFDGNELWADISNEGETDVSSSDTIDVYVYVDDSRKYSGTIAYNYFDAGESNSYSFLDGEFDEGESYDIEVCIDAKDNLDEPDEDNNCRTETLKLSSSSSGEPDLDVTEIYLDSDDHVNFTVTNKGSDDVNNGEDVVIKVYVDGSSEYSKTVTQSSSTTNFLDEDEEDTYDAGNILDDEGSTYEVEVCVDTGEDVDESSESNNCMTVDEDSIGSGSSEDCGKLTDIDGHWSEEYVCNLYDRDVVKGRSSTHFYPDSTTTRAEFLKMVLLDAELDTYSVSHIYYSDVSSSDWYYSYVTYATDEGYVDGYSDGTFKPNQIITRAEALVILMRVADQDNFDYDESDIDFWDVDVDDWFAYAVVIATQDDLVDGYGDDSFRPNGAITRGEAAKILDLAYEEYFK